MRVRRKDSAKLTPPRCSLRFAARDGVDCGSGGNTPYFMSELRIGPAGWNYKDWKGVFYPARRTRGFSELAYVAEYFDAVEINSSFYGPFAPTSAQKWLGEVAANSRFMFTGKLWQRFTHEGGGNLAEERIVRQGFDVLQGAGKLGAVLVQFPFSFHNTKDNFSWLGKVLTKFCEYPLVVEVRHATWDKQEVLDFLTERQVGFCNIDQPLIGRSLKPSAYATSPVGYVRFHGRRYDTWFAEDESGRGGGRYDYLYSRAEIGEWLPRITEVAEKTQSTYVVTNNHPAAKSLQLGQIIAALYFKTKQKMPESLLTTYPELHEFASAPLHKTTLF
jgi:uncharacterized protein YecE (DUF72 family)